jgi:hypothetical protein
MRNEIYPESFSYVCNSYAAQEAAEQRSAALIIAQPAEYEGG